MKSLPGAEIQLVDKSTIDLKVGGSKPAPCIAERKRFQKWMEELALKSVYNSLNTNIYSYLETSGGKSYILYLNVHFFTASVN